VTSPQSFGDAEQDRILTEIAGQLKHLLPPGWEYAQVKYSALGNHEEIAGLVHSVTGGMLAWRPPEVISELFRELRAVSANPVTGTWLTAVFEMKHPEAYKATFNGVEQPDFRTPPPAEAFTEELRLFPRSPENIPDWLRERTGGS
jgi:hypothetical protein